MSFEEFEAALLENSLTKQSFCELFDNQIGMQAIYNWKTRTVPYWVDKFLAIYKKNRELNILVNNLKSGA